MKYFFDNNVSYRYADMLKALEVDVVALRESFSESIEDVKLFEELKGSNHVFVSGDTSQTTRRMEAKALKETGMSALFFCPWWAKKKFWDQATWLITKWPIIDGYVRGVARGTCAELRENGRAMPFFLD